MVAILSYISIEKQNNALGTFFILFRQHYVFFITSILILVVAITITKRRNRLKKIKVILEKEKAVLQEISTNNSIQKEITIDEKLVNLTKLIGQLKCLLIPLYLYCLPLLVFLWYLFLGLYRLFLIIAIPFAVYLRIKQDFFSKRKD